MKPKTTTADLEIGEEVFVEDWQALVEVMAVLPSLVAVERIAEYNGKRTASITWIRRSKITRLERESDAH